MSALSEPCRTISEQSESYELMDDCPFLAISVCLKALLEMLECLWTIDFDRTLMKKMMKIDTA